MKKSEFDELIALRAELREIEMRIESLRGQLKTRTVQDAVKGSSDCFPYSLRSFLLQGEIDIEANRKIQKEIAKQREMLSRCRLHIAQQITRCEREIAEVPDSVTRQVLRLRYVDGLNWQAVASRMGYANESSPRRICEKYFRS